MAPTTTQPSRTQPSRPQRRPAHRRRIWGGDVTGRRRRTFVTQPRAPGKMAVLVRAGCWAPRPLLPVVQTWDLDPRRWVRALRRSPVKVLLPSGQVVDRKPGPGKQPRKAAAEARPHAQPLKQRSPAPQSQTPSTWEESGLRYDKASPGDKRLRCVFLNLVKYSCFSSRLTAEP